MESEEQIPLSVIPKSEVLEEQIPRTALGFPELLGWSMDWLFCEKEREERVRIVQIDRCARLDRYERLDRCEILDLSQILREAAGRW